MSRSRDKLSSTNKVPSSPLVRVHPSFQDAYPSIAALTMHVEEDNGMHTAVKATHDFTERNFSALIDCHNDACHGGGIHLDKILFDMIHQRQERLENLFPCEGREGTKTRVDRSCTHRFWVNAEIRYRSENQQPK